MLETIETHHGTSPDAERTTAQSLDQDADVGARPQREWELHLQGTFHGHGVVDPADLSGIEVLEAAHRLFERIARSRLSGRRQAR